MIRPEKLAAAYLDSNVRVKKQYEIGKCRLSVWERTIPYPPITATVCEDSNGAFLVSENVTSLQRFFSKCGLPMSSVEHFCGLLVDILPMNWRLLPILNAGSPCLHLEDYPSPELDGRTLIFFCNDYMTGKVIRCSVVDLNALSCEVVGDGLTGCVL